MFLFSIFFLMGDLILQTFSQIPANVYLYISLSVSILLFFFLKQYVRYYYLPFALALGFATTTWQANSLLSWSLIKKWEGKSLIATGHIASLPITDSLGSHFVFGLEQLQFENEILNKNTLIRLSWRNAPFVKVGDEWQLVVRLKRIHSVQNPGSFDFEALALQKGWRASGYVIQSRQNRLLNHHGYFHPIDQVRQMLQIKIQNHLPHSTTSPWLMALILGERNGMMANDWEILRMTGTNHLMAIAGLHIGMLAAWIHYAITWLWRRSERLLLYMPALHAGAYASLFAAILYSALAGFSLPTQRASIMLAVFISGILAQRKINALHSWSLALLLVLIINPLCVLSESFWLSFGTLALIIYGMGGRLHPKGWWWKWGRVQWVIGMGLIPLSLLLFQECSFISFIANSIAVPYLGFFILPFCFLGTIFLFISSTLCKFFFIIADKSLVLLWTLLRFFAHLHFASWQQTLPHFFFFTSMLGILLLLLPRGFPGRGLGLIWLMPLIFYKSDTPNLNDFKFTLLDVEQGLSAVVQTKNHLLIYDTGPRLSDSFDMGKRVLIPYLHNLNANKIDMLVISHGDNDHIGGASALLKSFPVTSIMTSVPEKLKTPFTHECVAGTTWKWDGIQFSFLYPFPDTFHLGNDSSCVLRVDNGNQNILLTGDIEKFAEKKLLSQTPSSLSTTILVAPHHGSKTSGLKEFIAQAHPLYVLYAIGYRNRYHFPHQNVVKTYEKYGTKQLNTSDSGAIQFVISSDKKFLQPVLYRVVHQRYWMTPP